MKKKSVKYLAAFAGLLMAVPVFSGELTEFPGARIKSSGEDIELTAGFQTERCWVSVKLNGEQAVFVEPEYTAIQRQTGYPQSFRSRRVGQEGVFDGEINFSPRILIQNRISIFGSEEIFMRQGGLEDTLNQILMDEIVVDKMMESGGGEWPEWSENNWEEEWRGGQ